jgi:glycosyltransferase involved in cell wall biosynthesis
MRSAGGTEPTVSVVVPTLDRPFRTAHVVRAILAGDALPLEILVVDQSEDDATERALDLIGDERVRHLPLRPPSTSAARKEAARAAQGEYVAFLDDDV